MILATLTIENYKQFTGTHHIEFPSTGIVGILGANGAGKTTLFEAIEWCLYNPRGIENLDVVPRGTAARTRVRVCLEDPYDGARYVVERSLRGGKASSAELFREDDAENRITQGPREVTRFVASRLIGLDHTAFVSTFFTRQKELSFFGNVSATERRVAVAKLLGYETIREAQGQLGKQRTRARNAAEALRAQYEEERAGRDFAAELAAADEGVTLGEGALIKVYDEAEVATAELATASQAAERWRDLERRDAALQAQLGRIEGAIGTARARRDNAKDTLAALDRQAEQRESLVPTARLLAERERTLAEQESARARHEQAGRLREVIARAEAVRRQAAQTAERAVREAKAEAIDEWLWQDDDDADPVAAIGRLRHVATRLDLDRARAEVALFERLGELATDHERKRTHHERCLQRMAQIEGEIRDITAGSAPEEALATSRQARERAMVTASSVGAEIKGLVANRDRLEKIVGVLQRTAFDEPASLCPTCQRPFSAEDAGATIQALSENIATSQRDEREVKQRASQAREAATTADRDIAAAETRLKALAEARERLGKGQGITAGAETELTRAAELLTVALGEAGRTVVPSDVEFASSRDHLSRAERVLRASQALGEIEAGARQQAQDADHARETLTTLGEIVYDEPQHQAARLAVIDARDAATRVSEIEKQLARREGVEAARQAALKELEAGEASQATVIEEREALHYSPTGLETAVAAESAARTTERDALDRLGDARSAVADARGRRQRLGEEHQRIEGLAGRADSLVREHETLNQIYDEFTAFDRYVANRVTPYLAEQTGELLATLTDGRYDQVQFDTDYGLRVFDGPIDSFPTTAFSGGERDVVALCARLALSRVVGAQAANPPSFLVLDEVFGALDQDRRAQVLQTLGVLSGTAEAYRQLFIISHVDDIRQSPIFDEVWRISEGSDGSQVERVDQVGALEET
ncbi:MAG: AAA family ATPase [Thermomicrobiales bacterium]